MTRPLDLPENQVRAIIRAARKEGARVEVRIGGAVVTVIPAEPQQPKGGLDREEDFRL